VPSKARSAALAAIRIPGRGKTPALVGIISQADVATNLDEEKVGDLVEAISAAP
jgi:hypothetical protein